MKKVIVILTALVVMSGVLGIADMLISKLSISTNWRNTIEYIFLMLWCVVTFKMVALKYKWIKKLTE